MRTGLLGLIVATLLTGVGGLGTTLHVCAAMGATSAGDCDCKSATDVDTPPADHDHEAHHGDHDRHAQSSGTRGRHGISASPCCSTEWSPATSARAVHEVAHEDIDEAQLVAWAPTGLKAVDSRHDGQARLHRERAPPRSHGPPLFVQHCSFLN